MIRHRAAVLGSPIAHSLSPLLHRTGYAECGLEDWSYSAYEVKENDLADFLLGLGPQWRGLSLTMPLKEEAVLVAGRASSLALQVGAANTLIRRSDGGWKAENTDVEGVHAALAANLPDDPHRDRAAIIGSGATARAVLAGLQRIGVTKVTFVVRKRARESTVAQAYDHGMTVDVVRLSDSVSSWAAADLLVNTTPSGAADNVSLALSRVPAPPGQVVLDCVYADWPTEFARSCEQRGATVLSGLEMLVHQAAAQFELMTGQPAPVAAMQDAGRAALSERAE